MIDLRDILVTTRRFRAVVVHHNGWSGLTVAEKGQVLRLIKHDHGDAEQQSTDDCVSVYKNNYSLLPMREGIMDRAMYLPMETSAPTMMPMGI